jgi:hypothetical protein
MSKSSSEPKDAQSANAASTGSATPPKAASSRVAKPASAVKPKRASSPTEGAKSAKGAAPADPVTHKREKLVRDSFTLPKGEYEALVNLKHRALGLAVPVKKSELLRAGVKALEAMTDAAFLAALKRVPAIKTGRPAK